MNRLTENLRGCEWNKRAVLAHLQTDIEIALTFLRLADAECKSGNHARASELIDKATLAYQTAIQHLDHLPEDATEEISGLRQGARELFEAIHIAEFRYAATHS